MKSILVPCDFSKESSYALKAAVVISKKTGAAVRLLHVLQTAFDREYNAGSDIPGEVKRIF